MAEPPSPHAALCLPQHIFDDIGMFVDNEVLPGNGLENELTQSLLGFPSEFPFEFDSPSLSSAFSSSEDSTESEESSDDEEDFFAGLSRRLALSTQRVPVPSFVNEKSNGKSRVAPSSPQSTLNGLGGLSASSKSSPNGPSPQILSPPATPFCQKDDTWDVIYAAAGQVARLNTSTENRPNHPNSNIQPFNRLFGITDLVPPLLKPLNAEGGASRRYAHTNQYLKHENALKQQCFSIWGSQTKGSFDLAEKKYPFPDYVDLKAGYGAFAYDNGSYMRSLGRQVSACPPAPQQQLNRGPSISTGMKGSFPTGSCAKRECAGTGVFLPRRYTNPLDSRKKSGSSNARLPAKPVKLNIDDAKPQQRSASGFGASQNDSLKAKRNLPERQRGVKQPGGPSNEEVPLPKEWTY